MMITRHFVDVGLRRVHYRRAGSGPPLLMIHQSPRSSAEYEPLIAAWAEHFTCIAPDTPGFGQSTPLADRQATINDYADAVVDLLDVLGLDRTAAYGFHSGGIILVTALKRHPHRFSCLAVGGYAVWTPDETALFGDRYLPQFQPSPFGEHLTWLWNRVLEQSWFFPWFAVDPRYRRSGAHADLARVDAAIQDFLASGNAYRAGYGAVLDAPRDIPAADAVTPPVLITAYDGDPLQEHIDRLGAMPAGWSAAKVATPGEHQSASLAFLRAHSVTAAVAIVESDCEGFVHIAAGGFDGAIHWRGQPGSRLTVHAPGRALELVEAGDGLTIDLPGHGLSSAWTGGDWDAVIAAVARHFGCTSVIREPAPVGDPDRLFPDLTPDRFGNYLTVAWSIVRASHLFTPWYAADGAHVRNFDAGELDPVRLADEHRALLRATAARSYMRSLMETSDEHS